MKHVNAKDVFTPETLAEVQKYYSGGYLWIPHLDRGKNETIFLEAEAPDKQ